MPAGSKRKAERKAERENTCLMRDCKCPFMVAILDRSIECEAPMDGAKNILRFEEKRQLKRHAGMYCTKNYCYCEVYRMVMAAKYED